MSDFTVAAAILFGLFAAYRIAKSVNRAKNLKRQRALNVHRFINDRKSEAADADHDGNPNAPKIDFGPDEVYSESNTTAPSIIILVGLACMMFGAMQISNTQDLRRTGLKTKGKIVKVEKFKNKKTGLYTYTPVIKFRDKNKKIHKIKGKKPSKSSKTYKVGKKVKVIYDAKSPKTRYMTTSKKTAPIDITLFTVPMVGFVILLFGITYYRRKM